MCRKLPQGAWRRSDRHGYRRAGCRARRLADRLADRLARRRSRNAARDRRVATATCRTWARCRGARDPGVRTGAPRCAKEPCVARMSVHCCAMAWSGYRTLVRWLAATPSADRRSARWRGATVLLPAGRCVRLHPTRPPTRTARSGPTRRLAPARHASARQMRLRYRHGKWDSAQTDPARPKNCPVLDVPAGGPVLEARKPRKVRVALAEPMRPAAWAEIRAAYRKLTARAAPAPQLARMSAQTPAQLAAGPPARLPAGPHRPPDTDRAPAQSWPHRPEATRSRRLRIQALQAQPHCHRRHWANAVPACATPPDGLRSGQAQAARAGPSAARPPGPAPPPAVPRAPAWPARRSKSATHGCRTAWNTRRNAPSLHAA